MGVILTTLQATRAPVKRLASTQQSHDVLCLNQTVGGVDESLYVGEIQYAPVYKQWYYEVVMVELRVDRHKIDVACKEVRA